MKKKVYGTVLSIGAAAVLIASNGIISANAFKNDEIPNVKVIGKHEQPATTSTELSLSNIQISNMEDSKEMAALRTKQDVNKEKAVELAKTALENKFDVSLNGTYATPIFATREDIEGTYYFVSFVPMYALHEDGHPEPEFDVYIASLDSKTGKMVSLEKNPKAPEGING
ncbi:hypothetical protein [Paenibacillus sp. FSL K6-2862]|uniref:hypothetical protein n=1 Tax=Paenibacillus sp. FSL K6-2862 TaxID=2921484 RepID=UPI0030F4D05F